MPLLTGRWPAFVNGTEGALTIDRVEASGEVTGSLVVPNMPSAPGLEVIRGFFEESSSTLTFFWFNGTVAFTGYHFQFPLRVEEGRDITHTLTGFCLVAPSGGGATFNPTARRQQFGWFAQLTQVV